MPTIDVKVALIALISSMLRTAAFHSGFGIRDSGFGIRIPSPESRIPAES